MSAEWPLVKAGRKGPRVKALQRLLLHRGADLAPDGDFGPDTTAALTAFQKANGLDADGVAGTATWTKVVVPVKSGQRGEPVTAVQELVKTPPTAPSGLPRRRRSAPSRSART